MRSGGSRPDNRGPATRRKHRATWCVVLLCGLAINLAVACQWPLEVRVELDREQYQPGEPIEGTILLRNRAAHKTTAEFSDSCSWQLKILRADTRAVVQWPIESCLLLLGEIHLSRPAAIS